MKANLKASLSTLLLGLTISVFCSPVSAQFHPDEDGSEEVEANVIEFILEYEVNFQIPPHLDPGQLAKEGSINADLRDFKLSPDIGTHISVEMAIPYESEFDSAGGGKYTIGYKVTMADDGFFDLPVTKTLKFKHTADLVYNDPVVFIEIFKSDKPGSITLLKGKKKYKVTRTISASEWIEVEDF